jgi:transcriptional regulator with XRE-family HTH domain
MPTTSKTTRRAASAKTAQAPAKRARTKVTDSARSALAAASPLRPLVPDVSLQTLARDLRSWTGFVLGLANTAADLSFRVAKARLTKPSQQAAVEKAGSVIRDLRESAGLTLADLGRAINLKDVSLLEGVEGGKVGLPFEIILRLAGVLGRNDPIPIALKLTRTYNPQLWKTLEGLGVGRLAVQAGREREFANLYRASDRARGLNDEEFAAALAFVRASFDAALEFREQVRKPDAE